MIDYTATSAQAKTYSDAVLKRLAGDQLPPLPPVFEVWYAYYARLNTDLVGAIDQLLGRSKTLSLAQCLDLHQKYMGRSRTEEAVRKASDQIQETISDISQMVTNVKQVTTTYQNNLSDVEKSIAQADSKDDIQKIISTVTAETSKVLSYNQNLEARLAQSASMVQTLIQDLSVARKEAMTDGLTGIPNRKAFDDRVREMAIAARDTAEPLTMLMIDIDHFKKFNDTYGHPVGDQVLKLVAKTLTDGIKGKDFAARYGGEEFVILLPETHIDGGVAVGNALRRALAAKEIINKTSGDKMGKITMSIGVSQFDVGETLEAFIKRADDALYTAKQNGRNQVASSRMK